MPPDPWVENRRHVKGYPHGRSVHIPRDVLRALARVCAACGLRDAARLVVDHVNRDSLDNRPGNLQVLCRACHLAKTPASPYLGFLRHDARRAAPAAEPAEAAEPAPGPSRRRRTRARR